jgi:hypothetical protein
MHDGRPASRMASNGSGWPRAPAAGTLLRVESLRVTTLRLTRALLTVAAGTAACSTSNGAAQPADAARAEDAVYVVDATRGKAAAH